LCLESVHGEIRTRFGQSPAQIRPLSYTFKVFRDVNDNVNMAVDGSATPVRFIADHNVPENSVWIITRVVIVVETSSIMAPFEFGNLPELENGIRIFWEDRKGLPGTALARFGMRRNSDLAFLATEGPERFSAPIMGPPQDCYRASLTLNKLGMEVILTAGERIVIEVNDDLTGLIRFRAACHGFIKGK